MRALTIFSSIGWVGSWILISPLAVASTQIVDLESRYTRDAGISEAGSPSPSIQALSAQTAFSVQGLPNGLSYRGALTLIQPDYSQLGLLDRDQNAILPPKNEKEIQGDAQLEWQHGQFESSFGYKRHLTKSPFSSNEWRASLGASFFNRGTRIKFETQSGSQRRPLTYFVDRDLRTKARATEVSHQGFSLVFEQVLSAEWKMGLKGSIQNRPEERPRSQGIEMSHSIALNQILFCKLGASYWSENRGESLKNERGYFEARGAEVSFVHEPAYGWLIRLGYGFSIEQESDPRVSREIQVGMDRYFMSLAREFRGTTYRISTAYARRNDGARPIEMSGGISWEI